MQAHGELECHWQGRVLVCYPHGPFNTEGVQRVFSQLKTAVAGHEQTPWHRIEVWDDQTMGSVAVVDTLVAMNDWCHDHGCQTTVAVIQNGLQASIVRRFLEPNVQVFEAFDEAMSWLSHKDA